MSIEPKDSHPLIEGYLKRSWSATLGSLAIKILVFTIIAAVGLYYYWRIIPPEKQVTLRESHPMIERTAFFLERNGLAPSTEDRLAAVERRLAELEDEKQIESNRGSQPRVPSSTAPERSSQPNSANEEKRVWDFREHFNVKPEKEDQTYVINDIDDNGNTIVKRVTLDELQKRLDLEEEKVKAYKEEERAHKEQLEVLHGKRKERKIEVDRLMQEGGLTVSWKVWDSNNPVTWDHFLNIEYHQEKKRWGAHIRSNISLSYNDKAWSCFAYMVPEGSWCRPGSDTEEALRHESLHFDLTELFTRKLRSEIYEKRNGKPSTIYKLAKQVRADLAIAQTTYDKESGHSRNKKMQQHWEKTIGDGLLKTNHLRWVPDPQKLALQKFHHGYFLLGQAYDMGAWGFDTSPKLAKKWYNFAIQSEVGNAMNNLAVMRQKGWPGEEPNLKKAFKLYVRSAKAGSSTGMFNAGIAYWRGLGVKQDRKKAAKWLVKSADHNNYARHALKLLEEEMARENTSAE